VNAWDTVSKNYHWRNAEPTPIGQLVAGMSVGHLPSSKTVVQGNAMKNSLEPAQDAE